jgi:outer membrane protein
MKKYIFVALILLFSPSLSYAQANQITSRPAPLTLMDCYNLALKQSEIIAIDAELINQAEARFTQALGTLLPHVTFSSTDTRLRSETTPSSNKTYERKFVFKQTLFSGFKEFAGMSGSRSERNQRINEKARAEQLLFVDVSDAFYLLMEEREDLKILQNVRKVLVDRIKELKKREQLGRSRRSEVVNTEVQLYTLETELELIRSQELVAKQLLEFLIGRPVGNIFDLGETVPLLRAEKDYLIRAAMRPDVLAAQQAWETSKKSLEVSKSGLLPTVSLQSDYYTQRNTSPADAKWDALLKVEVPIFQGTETYGAIREAGSKMRVNQLQLMRLGRNILQEISDSYLKCQSAISNNKIVRKALTANRMNYYLQNKDYQLNLVNNLDVLTAIRSLEDARRNYIHSLYETKRLYWQLCVAAGEPMTEK